MAAPVGLSNWFYIFVIWTFSTCTKGDDLERTIQTISKYLKYQLHGRHDLYVDAVFALRVLEGTAQHLADTASSGSLAIDPYQLEDVGSLKVDAKVLIEKALPKLEQSDSTLVKQRWNQISQPWVARKHYRLVDPQYRWTGKKKQPIDPIHHAQKLSRCLVRLTERGHENPPQRHEVEDRCVSRTMMLAEDTEAAALKVQIDYFLAAELYGFGESMEQVLQHYNVHGGLEEVYMRLCTNAFYMTRGEVRGSQLTDPELYLDMAFLCGSLGFMQFLHADWLDAIIQWQLPHGCFNVQFNGKYGECEHHLSAHIIATLSQYMVFLAQPGSLAYQGVVSIQGYNYLRDHIELSRDKIRSINGAEFGEDDGSGSGFFTILVVFIVLVAIITVFILRKKGRKSDDGDWTLPMTGTYRGYGKSD